MKILPILLGKIILMISQKLNLGSGSTWPGHIALYLNKNFIRDSLEETKVKAIVIAGTNGKTTTSKLIRTILENNKHKVMHNEGGANLLNGIASLIIKSANPSGILPYDYAILETDENTMPLLLEQISPDYLVVLNLFRDQLDRYGEIDIVARSWKASIETLSKKTTLVLNADDPQIAFLGKDAKQKVKYFGVEGMRTTQDTSREVSDVKFCPNCSKKLQFKNIVFSHLGDWQCPECKFTRPKPDYSRSDFYPLPGTYNAYNTNAAILVSILNHVDEETIARSLKSFSPAFGRQEELVLRGKKIKIFLSKNPTSFNESFKTIIQLGGKNVLFILNNRIPDGVDVSWIWDTNLEHLNKLQDITVSGDRTYDMALRLKYEGDSYEIQNSKFKIQNYNVKLKIEKDLKKAIQLALREIPDSQTLYVLPTYSAMLEVRKILTGKKIL